MSDRLEITTSATLPEKGKHGILAHAEHEADNLAVALTNKHGIAFTAVTKAIRPGKKVTPIVQATTIAPEPVSIVGIEETTYEETETLPAANSRLRRHAAE